MNITVVMTGDEEAPGRPLTVARAALVAAAKGAAAAIGFEDGDGDPTHLVIARRGTTSWIVTVKGTPAHSSQIFRPEVGRRRDLRSRAPPRRASAHASPENRTSPSTLA